MQIKNALGTIIIQGRTDRSLYGLLHIYIGRFWGENQCHLI